jgi:hypothetical protein
MAYDIFTGKRTARSWSIGTVLMPGETPESYGRARRESAAAARRLLTGEVVRWQTSFTPPARPFTESEQVKLIQMLRDFQFKQQAEIVFAGKPFSAEQVEYLSAKLKVAVPQVSRATAQIPVASNVLSTPIAQQIPGKKSGVPVGPIIGAALMVVGISLVAGSGR